jgi:homoserine dehydrogenase
VTAPAPAALPDAPPRAAGARPRVRITREPRTMRLALAGCGSVGGGLVTLLASDAGRAAAHAAGLRFNLTSVLVRREDAPRPPELSRELLTRDADAFLAAAATDADVVVEAIGGMHPAGEIARAALASGRRFVTANKALIAAHGVELAALASRNRRAGAALDFEAAVGGAVPIVRTLRDGLGGVGITSVEAILNGTTNYILSSIADGVPFARALADAQARGFAESDPTRDLDGRDAADKLAIVAWLAFGTAPGTVRADVRGITHGADALAHAAAARGGTLRLIARVDRTADGITASVLPTVVGQGSPFARVPGEENLAIIRSASSGEVRLSGRGAGGTPTAAAIFADLLRPARPLRPPSGIGRSGEARARSERWMVVASPSAADALHRRFLLAGLPIERDERVGAWTELGVRGTLQDVIGAGHVAGLDTTEWWLARCAM